MTIELINHKQLKEMSLPHSLEESKLTPSHSQIFMFSAATWNRHQIHYNKNLAQAEGHQDILVQRALIGNFMAKLLRERFDNSLVVKSLSWKVLYSALPGCELRSRGAIEEIETINSKPIISCKLEILNQEDRLIATGQASLELS